MGVFTDGWNRLRATLHSKPNLTAEDRMQLQGTPREVIEEQTLERVQSAYVTRRDALTALEIQGRLSAADSAKYRDLAILNPAAFDEVLPILRLHPATAAPAANSNSDGPAGVAKTVAGRPTATPAASAVPTTPQAAAQQLEEAAKAMYEAQGGKLPIEACYRQVAAAKKDAVSSYLSGVGVEMQRRVTGGRE